MTIALGIAIGIIGIVIGAVAAVLGFIWFLADDPQVAEGYD